jgi:hypothetical protein
MTKIILTGATGLVGSQVLKAAIADHRITSIVILSRRALPNPTLSENAKVTVLIHKDFEVYPPELVEQLRGAEAVIWCIGGMIRSFPDVATARKVQVTYALTLAEALINSKILPLKFVFCSGAFAERNQGKRLWVLGETRKIKGEAESGLAALAADNDGFEAFQMRLGGVMPDSGTGNLAANLIGWMGLVKVEQVSKVFIDVAIRGAAKEILENSDIVKYRFS